MSRKHDEKFTFLPYKSAPQQRGMRAGLREEIDFPTPEVPATSDTNTKQQVPLEDKCSSPQ